MHPPDRRCPVRAGLGPFQERLQVAQEVRFPVRCRLSVYAYGTVFPSAEVSCLQPTQVDVVGQRSESHSWRLLRQLGYPLLFCEHGIEFRCTRHVSLQRFHDEGISIPRQGPSGFVPLRHRYDEMLRLPDALVAALRSLRLAIPPLASVFVTPLRPDAGRGPGALSLAAPRQWLRTGDARISQVPGEPCCAYALFSDPGRTAVTRPLQCSGMAPAMATAKAPTIRHFRGSIARLGHSLSTLRRASHLAATQDSFSGAGQALPDGIGYPQGSDERFPSCFLHLFLLSQAFLTQCHFAMVSGGTRCVILQTALPT